MLDKIAIITILLFGQILLSSAANSGELTYQQTLRAVSVEEALLKNSYIASYDNKALADYVKSAFHDALLESHPKENYVILIADKAQRTKLIELGFNLEFAQIFVEKRLQELDIITAKAERSAWVAPQQLQVAAPKTSAMVVSSATAISQGIPDFSCYETVEETLAVAQDLASSYPELATIIDIGDSWKKTQGLGGYDLLVLKITNSAIQQNKPVLFIHSAMHARELTTAALTLDFAKQLLTQYGKDPDISWVVDYREIHILFHMNPDGRKMAEAGFDKRKNTNTTYCSGNGLRFGVDLNRNFGAFWNAGGFDPAYANASSAACAITYRGPFGSSEPETQAVEMYVRSLYPDNRGPNDTDAAPDNTQGLHIDVHSSGGDILYPWGHSYLAPPNQQALATLARKIAIFNGYEPKPANGIYLLDGNSESVSYGELGIPQLTFELGTKFRETCALYEEKIKPDNLQALLYAAKISQAPYQLPAGSDMINLASFGDAYGRVNIGDSALLAATAIDSRYQRGVQVLLDQFNQPVLSGSGLRQFETVQEPFEQVMAAEYSIDIPPTEAGALVYSMAAKDFLFDESEEQVQANLTVSGLVPGQHTLFYRAQDSNGQWGALSAQYFTVNEPLKARFGVVCTGNVCQFYGDQSLNFDGTIESYAWNFGGEATSNEINPSHIYSAIGSYPVTLTITDDKGKQASFTGSATPWFLGDPPVARFSATCQSLVCQLDASSSSDTDTSIARYEWAFPNGDTATGITVDYTFTQVGGSDVTLLVTDQSGLQSNTTNTLLDKRPTNQVSGGTGGGGSTSLTTLCLMLMAYLFRGKN